MYKIAYNLPMDRNLTDAQEKDRFQELEDCLEGSKFIATRYFLMLAAHSLQLDLIIITNTDPISVYRPFIDEFQSNTNLEEFTKRNLMSTFNASSVAILSRFPIGRPLLFGYTKEDYQKGSWFQYWDRGEKELTKLDKSLSGAILGPLQVIPDSDEVVYTKNFPGDQEIPLYTSSGKIKESKQVHDHWVQDHLNTLEDDLRQCKHCANNGNPKQIWKSSTSKSNIVKHMSEKH